MKNRAPGYAPANGGSGGGNGYWWEEQSSGQPKRELAWWEELTADLPEGDGGYEAAHAHGHYKPAYKPYVPRSAAARPGAPRVKYEPRPLKKYWWQK